MLIKPSNSLEKSLLFCKFLLLDARITTDSEAVLNTAEQIDLPWLVSFLEDPLRIMSQLDCKDGVCLGGANA